VHEVIGVKETNFSSSGIDEMASLLKLADDSQPLMNSGYVDVLGERDAIGPHLGQQVFRRKFLALIYERFWRPLVSRFFFGFGGPTASEERQLTMEMLAVSPGDRVIDVGCGPGNYIGDLAAAAGSGLVVGTDASEAMVAAATKRNSSANSAYLRADACALPFEDGTFDAACSVGVIHMIEKPMLAFAEMVRVLAPGGRLTVVVSCAPPGEPGYARGGVTVFAHDEVTGALRDHGLVDIDQRMIRRGQFVSARKLEADPNGR
jgi:SAM-dependent methyltransferase